MGKGMCVPTAISMLAYAVPQEFQRSLQAGLKSGQLTQELAQAWLDM